MSKTGFVGLGIMGKPMAANLLRADCRVVVNDLNMAAVEELQALGAEFGDYKKIAEECDRIILILPNGSIVKSVLFGEKGITQYAPEGCTVCDCSSVTPLESRYCAQKLSEKGIGFLDAPVSGGEPGAISGTLAFMAGGSEENFNKFLPLFQIMGSSAALVGDTGSGSITKLANQIIVNNTIAAVSEAFTFVCKAGADPQKAYEAIRGGLAGSMVLDAKIPKILERDFAPGGKISINHKDIKNVLETAHAIDAPVPLSAQLFEIMQCLKVAGSMDEDHCAIVKYFERLGDVVVQKKE